jgi:TPR repeat protein
LSVSIRLKRFLIVQQAAEFYLKASDLGHAKSAYNLAVMILQNLSDGSLQQAMTLLEKAADMGLKEVSMNNSVE